MKGKIRTGRWLAVFLMLAASTAIHAAEGAPPSGTLVGKPAPGFTAVTLKGERIDLKGILGEGRAVVLNFWGLRCANCITEIPVLNGLQEKHAGRARFLGINVDGVDAPFLEKQMTAGQIVTVYDVVPDPEMALIDLYRMNAAPYTLVIDPSGTVRYQHEDYKAGDEKELERAIEDALPKKAQQGS